jgi:hypothetical protein
MSGSKQKSRSSSSTTQTLNPWSQNQWQTQADQIRDNIADYKNGIAGYGGDLTAGISDAEQRAGGLIDQYTGSWRPQMDNLTGMLDAANFTQVSPQTFADFNADTYVNPYAQDMIDATNADLQLAADRQRAQSTSDSLTNNAWGGSRQGVREGMLDEGLLRAIANNEASTRYNVWNAGADRFYQDVGNQTAADQYNNDLQLTRTQGLAGLLDQQQGYQNEDIQRLMDYGATTRSIEDRALAAQYADRLRQRQEEQTALGLDFGLLGSIPMLVNTTGESSSVQSSNPGALGIAGTLMGGAGAMFGSNGLFGTGGIFGPKA